MNLSRQAAEILRPAIDLIYSPPCPLCGEGIADQAGLCLDCWQTLELPGGERCARCEIALSDRLEKGEAGKTCSACLAAPPVYDGLVSATRYNQSSRALVLAFKHGRRLGHAAVMARMMAARLDPRDGHRLIVPVPLHRWRLWHRGFNQSAVLARRISRIIGARVSVDALHRTKRTPPLGGLGKRARARTLAGAIRVSPQRSGQIAGADILLIDDVMTSGATVSECCRALKKAGARSVKIACFARVSAGSGEW
jgi:ComF family protein